jgi:RNA-directed DNA polymerase
VLLDEVDKELERGASFARYADDCNVYVGSQGSERVMACSGSCTAA